MSYKSNKKYYFILLFICFIAYIIFFGSMIYQGTFFQHHNLFILGSLLFISFCVLLLSIQEKNRILIISTLLLIILTAFEMIVDWFNLIDILPWLNNVFDIPFHFIVSNCLFIFTLGIYHEMMIKRRQRQINLTFYENNEAIYLEYIPNEKKFVIEFSKTFIQKYQLSTRKRVVSFKDFTLFIHPEDRINSSWLAHLLNLNLVYDKKFRIKFPGMATYAYMIIRNSFIIDGCLIMLGFDISDIEETNKNLISKMEELDIMETEKNKIIANTKELIAKIALDGTIVYTSRYFTEIYPNENSTIIGCNVFELNEKMGHYDHSWFQHTIKNSHSTFQSKIINNNITTWISWDNEALYDKDGNVEYIICVGHDVSELITLNQELEYQNYHNSLTGLLNYEGLITSINKLSNVDKAICFYIDIRNFSSIMDYYGVIIGEALIVRISEDLKQYVKKGNLVANFYKSKFVVMMFNPTEKDIQDTFKLMENSILMVYDAKDAVVQLKKNIGYACYPKDTQDLGQLISLASLAMKRAEENDHNVIVQYEPEMSKKLDDNIKTAFKLRNAIHEANIDIYFQKIIHIESNQVKYLEALARWRDPELGYISPELFFKVALESNLIDYLEEYLVRQAIQKYATLKKIPEYQWTKLALNLAPSTFLRSDFINYIENQLQEFGLDNHEICIEVSENTFVHNFETCNYFINSYKQRGFEIAIDDFGREYSSLSILENIHYDIIKIDRSFINNMSSVNNQAIIQMIIEIAKYSNKEIIAEGVERQIESEQLKQRNCYLQQGYLHHKPEKLI